MILETNFDEIIGALNNIGFSFVECTQNLGQVSFWNAEEDNIEYELIVLENYDNYYREKGEEKWLYNCNLKKYVD